MWPEGEEPRCYDWEAGTMIVPPNMWLHQHFNTGTTPARYLAFKHEGVATGTPKACRRPGSASGSAATRSTTRRESGDPEGIREGSSPSTASSRAMDKAYEASWKALAANRSAAEEKEHA